MKLIPEKRNQQAAFFAIILAVGALYGFYQYWYTNRQDELAAMEARLEQLEDQNRRAQIVATRGGKELEEKLALYERHLLRLEQLIPESEEVPALLNSMAVEARQNRVELALMRPEEPLIGEYYTTRSFNIGVMGEYHDVGRFLTAIASLPRIVTPVDLDMSVSARSSNREEESEDKAPVLAQFNIKTYVIPPAVAEQTKAELTAGGGG